MSERNLTYSLLVPNQIRKTLRYANWLGIQRNDVSKVNSKCITFLDRHYLGAIVLEIVRSCLDIVRYSKGIHGECYGITYRLNKTLT